MNYYVLSLFPEIVENSLNASITGRAIDNELISLTSIDIRDFSDNKHMKVDDYPYGGGAGMVMQADVIYNAYKSIKKTNAKDIYMSPQGQVLIQKLTKELEKIKFDRAYSSTSRRAIKTIEPIVEKQNLKIEESDELCEMYFGIYDGWKWEDVNKIQPEIKQTQNEINEIVGIPGQESMEETAKRMYNYIFKIVKENEGKTILISSHGVAIEAFLRKIENIKFRYEREKFCQYNVAINEFEFKNDKFKIIRLADLYFLYK